MQFSANQYYSYVFLTMTENYDPKDTCNVSFTLSKCGEWSCMQKFNQEWSLKAILSAKMSQLSLWVLNSDLWTTIIILKHEQSFNWIPLDFVQTDYMTNQF
jgi:hypothetical protein